MFGALFRAQSPTMFRALAAAQPIVGKLKAAVAGGYRLVRTGEIRQTRAGDRRVFRG